MWTFYGMPWMNCKAEGKIKWESERERRRMKGGFWWKCVVKLGNTVGPLCHSQFTTPLLSSQLHCSLLVPQTTSINCPSFLIAKGGKFITYHGSYLSNKVDVCDWDMVARSKSIFVCLHFYTIIIIYYICIEFSLSFSFSFSVRKFRVFFFSRLEVIIMGFSRCARVGESIIHKPQFFLSLLWEKLWKSFKTCGTYIMLYIYIYYIKLIDAKI